MDTQRRRSKLGAIVSAIVLALSVSAGFANGWHPLVWIIAAVSAFALVGDLVALAAGHR